MKIKLGNHITLIDAPESLTRKICATFTLYNPVYLDNEKMGRWNGQTEPRLYFFEQTPSGLLLPRGTLGLIIYFCKELNIPTEIIDGTRKLPHTDFAFNGTLKGYQKKAIQDILTRNSGVLQAPAGSGKTVMALGVIVERKQSTLVIVHSKELLNQWIDRITSFLGIPKSEIGVIGNSKLTIGEKITVGIINSVYGVAEDVKKHFGHIIVDECHRCPSRTFTQAVTAFDSKYMLGLSATPYRRDGLTKLISWYLGPQVKVEQDVLTEDDVILDVEVITRETNFSTWVDASDQYTTVLSELCEDPERNELIVRDVAREARNGGGVCLVLSDRKSHCETLASMLLGEGISADVLTGDTSKKDREDIVSRLVTGSVRVLVATGQLIGEGFDAPSLQTLFLATPVRFDGRLIQYLGRVLRTAPGKDKAKIYDYIDPIGVLQASAKARTKVYQNLCGRSQ